MSDSIGMPLRAVVVLLQGCRDGCRRTSCACSRTVERPNVIGQVNPGRNGVLRRVEDVYLHRRHHIATGDQEQRHQGVNRERLHGGSDNNNLKT